MLFFARTAILVVASTILAACATHRDPGQARHVLVEKGSGVVALPITTISYEERWNREKAMKLIAEKCGPKFEITREEEVAIADIEEQSLKSAEKTIVKTKARDYRITYICK